MRNIGSNRIGLARPCLLLWVLFLVQLICVAAPALHASELDAVRRLLKDPSPASRAAAVRRLAGDDARSSVSVVVHAMGDRHPYVRRAAAGVLGLLLESKARSRVRGLVRKQRSPALRAAACNAYRTWFDEQGRAALKDAMADRESVVRVAALRALARWAHDALPTAEGASERAAPPSPTLDDLAAAARRLLDDKDGLVRATALLHLDGKTLPASEWIAHSRDEDWRVRLAALEGSVAVGGVTAVVAVLHGLNEAVWSVRLTAAELAGIVLDRRVLEALPALLADPRQRVRDAAHQSLMQLSGIPFDPIPDAWRTWLRGDGKAFDPATAEVPERRKKSMLRPGTNTVVRALGVPVASGHVAFALDTSGSMGEATTPGKDGKPRTRWQAVCEEMNAAMKRLDGAQIAVHCFSTDVRSFAGKPVALKAGARRRLATFLEKQAVGGRTALYDGIARALADESIDTILVLSDGAPSAGSWFTKTDLLAGIVEANRWRRARIHVIAVGVDGIAKRWRDVLKRIAKGHGGKYVAR